VVEEAVVVPLSMVQVVVEEELQFLALRQEEVGELFAL
jgi:hypothetical protein